MDLSVGENFYDSICLLYRVWVMFCDFAATNDRNACDLGLGMVLKSPSEARVDTIIPIIIVISILLSCCCLLFVVGCGLLVVIGCIDHVGFCQKWATPSRSLKAQGFHRIAQDVISKIQCKQTCQWIIPFFNRTILVGGFKHFLFSIIYGMIYQDNLHIFTGGFLILSSHVSFFRS